MRIRKTIYEGWPRPDLFVVQNQMAADDRPTRVFAQEKVGIGEGTATEGTAEKEAQGIRQIIFWPEDLAGSNERIQPERVRKWTARKDYVSERPFEVGDPCDGTRDTAVWAALIDALQRSGEATVSGFQTDLRAAGEKAMAQNLRRPAFTKRKAEWEGIQYPARWGREAADRLLESLESMNYHTVASVIRGIHGDGPQHVETWMEAISASTALASHRQPSEAPRDVA
jgi:hypothetical protein